MAGLQATGAQCRAFVLVAGFVAFGLAPIFGADSIPGVLPDLHTFTNQSGKTIQAIITDVTLDNVFLKRDDGQAFKVPLTTFSPDDQNYISQWVVRRARTQGSNILKLDAASNKLSTATSTPNGNEKRAVMATNGKVGHATIKNWSEGYNVTITNLLPAHFAKLQLRYIIFSMSAVPGGLPPNDYTPNVTVGQAIDIDDLPANAVKTVATGEITLAEYTAPPNFVYSNGAAPKITDQLKGIWVRVYDENNILVQEWASSENLNKNNDWDALIKQASDAPSRRGGFNTTGVSGFSGGRRGGSGTGRGSAP